MTIDNVSLGVSAGLRAGVSSRFFLPGASEFAAGLNLGQIIKGKVLRQYEGDRYLVNFNGHERIVDSGVPLTTGELIHGRVIGLGERVELQRVHAADGNDAQVPKPGDAGTAAEATVGDVLPQQRLDVYATRYRADLSSADKTVLMRATHIAADADAMALVGVMLNKLGLAQSPDLLWPLYRALQREDAASAALFNSNEIPQLDTVSSTPAALAAAAVRELAATLLRQMQPSAEPQSRDDTVPLSADGPPAAAQNAAALGLMGSKPVRGDTGQDDTDPRRLAHRMLNVQTGGAVAHRLGTVPLLLGNRLIEVDLAFFEQREDHTVLAPTKHRKVVFSLHTDHLGQVEITANVSGPHVRVQIITDDHSATGEVSAHVNDLRTALAAGNWKVDEVVYQTRQAGSRNGVVRAVVEHVIRQDSLNSLV